MAGFFSNLISNIFGSSSKKDEDEMPDDGGLAEFAKQLARELAEEEKLGKRKTVSADSVLSVQHGRHGSKTYLLDSRDFHKAIAKELRDSVSPVIEGILKTRCGEKGTGFMSVKSLYIFHVRREDSVAEYNAAMDIIDDIGSRLLGDRYLKGDRKVDIPVAQVLPKDLFDLNGTFDFKKAATSIKLIREVGAHGPASVDWETGEVNVAEGAPDWVENEVTPISKQLGNWERQRPPTTQSEDLGEWEKIQRQKREKEQKEWQTLEHKPQKVEEKSWQTIEKEQKETQTQEVSWTTIEKTKSPPDEDVQETAPPTPEPEKPKVEAPVKVRATDLQELGIINLGFRPSWNADVETINLYVANPYRKVGEAIFQGEQVYPDDMDPASIAKIDQAIAHQASLHLQRTKQIEDKTVVLPFHLSSLLIVPEQSPLKSLHALDENICKSVWIEIVGLGSNASHGKINTAISNHSGHFETFGIRLELGDISRSLMERSQSQFVSCDVTASQTHGLQMHSLDRDLPDLLQMAKALNKKTCTWGVRNRDDLQTALKNGSAFINGHVLAKELRRPGRIIPMSSNKLLSL